VKARNVKAGGNEKKHWGKNSEKTGEKKGYKGEDQLGGARYQPIRGYNRQSVEV